MIGGLLRSREMAVFSVLVGVVVVTTIKRPGFLFGSDSWRDLLLSPSILVLLAVGQAVVIITRNVDLSVSSILGLTAYLTGRLFIDHPGLPIVAVVLAGVLAGAALGAVNGLLVAIARVPALVITLGTLYIYRGIVLSWAGSDRINAGDMPREFLRLGTRSVLSIPILTIVSLVVLVAVGYYLHSHRGGRELYAIGSDPDAAVLYGLPVRRRVIAAFVLSGAIAGLTGVIFAARYGTVSSGAGTGHRAAGGRPPSSSVAWRSSAAAAPSGAPPSAPSCWSRSTARCRSSASRTSGSEPSSGR